MQKLLLLSLLAVSFSLFAAPPAVQLLQNADGSQAFEIIAKCADAQELFIVESARERIELQAGIKIEVSRNTFFRFLNS